MTTATQPRIATSELHDEAMSRIRGYSDPAISGRRTAALLAACDRTLAEGQPISAAFEQAYATSDDYDTILATSIAVGEQNRLGEAALRIKTRLLSDRQISTQVGQTYGNEFTAPALRFLDDQMTDLMSMVRETAFPLRDVASADDAFEEGLDAQAAWSSMKSLVERYKQIRSTQQVITVTLVDRDDREHRRDALNRSGSLRCAFDFEQAWVGARIFAYRTGLRDVEPSERQWIEWVRDVPAARFERLKSTGLPSDEVGYLRWLAVDNKAWVPTEAELLTIDDLAETMLSRRPMKTRHGARDAYYSDRGLTPATTEGDLA